MSSGGSNSANPQVRRRRSRSKNSWSDCDQEAFKTLSAIQKTFPQLPPSLTVKTFQLSTNWEPADDKAPIFLDFDKNNKAVVIIEHKKILSVVRTRKKGTEMKRKTFKPVGNAMYKGLEFSLINRDFKDNCQIRGYCLRSDLPQVVMYFLRGQVPAELLNSVGRSQGVLSESIVGFASPNPSRDSFSGMISSKDHTDSESALVSASLMESEMASSHQNYTRDVPSGPVVFDVPLNSAPVNRLTECNSGLTSIWLDDNASSLNSSHFQLNSMVDNLGAQSLEDGFYVTNSPKRQREDETRISLFEKGSVDSGQYDEDNPPSPFSEIDEKSVSEDKEARTNLENDTLLGIIFGLASTSSPADFQMILEVISV